MENLVLCERKAGKTFVKGRKQKLKGSQVKRNCRKVKCFEWEKRL